MLKPCSCSRELPSTSGRDGLDQKVVAVYKGVGLIMKRFTTGRVPKAFKIIPNLQNWEEVCSSTLARTCGTWQGVHRVMVLVTLHATLHGCAVHLIHLQKP